MPLKDRSVASANSALQQKIHRFKENLLTTLSQEKERLNPFSISFFNFDKTNRQVADLKLLQEDIRSMGDTPEDLLYLLKKVTHWRNRNCSSINHTLRGFQERIASFMAENFPVDVMSGVGEKAKAEGDGDNLDRMIWPTVKRSLDSRLAADKRRATERKRVEDRKTVSDIFSELSDKPGFRFSLNAFQLEEFKERLDVEEQELRDSKEELDALDAEIGKTDRYATHLIEREEKCSDVGCGGDCYGACDAGGMISVSVNTKTELLEQRKFKMYKYQEKLQAYKKRSQVYEKRSESLEVRETENINWTVDKETSNAMRIYEAGRGRFRGEIKADTARVAYAKYALALSEHYQKNKATTGDGALASMIQTLGQALIYLSEVEGSVDPSSEAAALFEELSHHQELWGQLESATEVFEQIDVQHPFYKVGMNALGRIALNTVPEGETYKERQERMHKSSEYFKAGGEETVSSELLIEHEYGPSFGRIEHEDASPSFGIR